LKPATRKRKFGNFFLFLSIQISFCAKEDILST
jgi:hypothetical protein